MPVESAAGLGIAALVAQFPASRLLGISARDPWTFGAVALLLTGITLLAGSSPARRATRVDPVVALRDS